MRFIGRAAFLTGLLLIAIDNGIVITRAINPKIRYAVCQSRLAMSLAASGGNMGFHELSPNGTITKTSDDEIIATIVVIMLELIIPSIVSSQLLGHNQKVWEPQKILIVHLQHQVLMKRYYPKYVYLMI